jgi:hypothetical protein
MKMIINILVIICLFQANNLYSQKFEDAKIYSLQIKIKTAGIADAGTDDRVLVQFNSGMRAYHLDLAKDDRERNSYDSYNILDEKLLTIKDLQFLTLTKQGTDGWAIRSIRIVVNSIAIFEKNYNNYWIDGNKGHSPILTINNQELRSNFKWGFVNGDKGILKPNVSIISNLELRNMIESLIGNEIRYIPNATINWGSTSGINTLWGEAVEIKRISDDKIHVDLDLQVALKGPNPELDVDFDIVVKCESNKIVLEVENFIAKVDYLNLFNVKTIKQNLLKNLNRSFDNVYACTAHFQPNGSLSFF